MPPDDRVITRFDCTRKNRNKNAEMDDGNKEDWEDQEWRNKGKGRCGKHNLCENRLTLRAPSARYLASEWRCAAPVGDETRRAATPVQSPSSTNLPPAVPCCGKFHLPRSPISGCKTWLHEIGAEISVAMFSVYQKFVGLAILVEN